MINKEEAINFAVGYLESLIKDAEEQRWHLDEDIKSMSRAVQKIKDARTSADPAPGSRPNSHAAELTGAIHDVLLAERPLHRKVILQRVTQAGIYVGGQKPLAALGSYLSLDKRFKNVARGVWTLAEEPGDTGVHADDNPLRPVAGFAEENL